MDNLFVLLAGSVPGVVLILFAFRERQRREKLGERPPIGEKLLRPPGHSLSRRMEDIGDDISTWMVGATICSFAFTFVLLRPDSAHRGADILALIMFGVGAAVCSVLAWRKLLDLRSYRLGLRGEQSMAEQLQPLVASGCRIFHDLPGGGAWNIDHVVVGPTGVFAIETKCRTKRPSTGKLRDQDAVFDGRVIHFPWCDDAKAPDQARSNARWLGQELSKAVGQRVSVQPIVALPGWWVTLKADSDVKVLSGKQVAGFISNELAILSPKQVQQIAYQLEQRCRDVEF